MRMICEERKEKKIDTEKRRKWVRFTKKELGKKKKISGGQLQFNP